MIGILIRQRGDGFNGDNRVRETARILRDLADRYESGNGLAVIDSNGNTCGDTFEAVDDGDILMLGRSDYIDQVEKSWAGREANGTGNDIADYVAGALNAFVKGNTMPGTPAKWVIGLMSGHHPFTGDRMKPARKVRKR